MTLEITRDALVLTNHLNQWSSLGWCFGRLCRSNPRPSFSFELTVVYVQHTGVKLGFLVRLGSILNSWSRDSPFSIKAIEHGWSNHVKYAVAFPLPTKLRYQNMSQPRMISTPPMVQKEALSVEVKVEQGCLG